MADLDAEYGKLYCRLLICLPKATLRCLGLALLSVDWGDPVPIAEPARIPLVCADVVEPATPAGYVCRGRLL